MTFVHLTLLTLAKTTPLLLATLGGLLSESAGVVNFALEGMMLAGAFGGVWAAIVTGSPWAGLAAAAGAGLFVGLLHALACLSLKANPIVSSIALNLLASGLTGLLLHQVFHAYGSSPEAPTLPVLDTSFLFPRGHAPSTGLSVMDPLAILAGVAIVAWFRWSVGGLRLRACGENPQAARAAGLSVTRIRWLAVASGGVLAGAGGAALSIGELSQFVENMTQGRGYLAIAALILARWRPGGVLLAALFFGFTGALSEWCAVLWPRFPSQLFLALPYLVCLAVLTARLGRRGPPSGLLSGHQAV